MFVGLVSAVPGERTFWTVCWDEHGYPEIESDRWPHALDCDNKLSVNYGKPQLKVHVTDELVRAGNTLAVVAAVHWVNAQLEYDLFLLSDVYDFDIIVGQMPKYGSLLGIGFPHVIRGRVYGSVNLFGRVDKFTVAHELLHALGMAHDVFNRDSIMYPYHIDNHEFKLTNADRQAILRRYYIGNN